MKRVLATVCILFVATIAYGDFTVYSDKNTDEVVFIVEEGDRVKISFKDGERLQSKNMKGNIRDYDLTEAYTDYKLQGTRFIVNTKKISDRVNAVEAIEASVAKGEEDKLTAFDKLIELGFTEDETKVILNR